MKGFKMILSVTVVVFSAMCFMPVLSKAEMSTSMMKAETMAAKGEAMAHDVMKTEPAIGGFCPTCLIHGKKMKGSAAYTSTYEGKVYMFTSAETKKFFDDNPAENAKAAQMKYDAEMMNK